MMQTTTVSPFPTSDDMSDCCLLHRYIPEKFLSELDELSDVAKKEINALNINLVHQLKSADTAFSLGESHDASLCWMSKQHMTKITLSF